jgi:MTH538 TIR-like domain (DUF1863)
MPKRQVFYSFHYDNDVMRVQQVRNIGAIDASPILSANDWEKVKQNKSSIKKWIDDNMSYRSCVIVLIGRETANREWVQYEIKKAWNEGKGIFGIYIHNLKCPTNGKDLRGKNPFEHFTLEGTTKSLAEVVKCYEPSFADAYNDIANNIESWIESAIAQRQRI